MNNKIIAATAIALIGLGSYAAWANVPGNAKGASQAGQQTHTTSVGGLELPQYIGPLEFIGETGGTDPRISATYSYRAMGLALDIHVSDLGSGGIADGTTSAELMRRFEATKQALVAATEVHKLKARESTVPFASGDARAVREAIYHFERRGEGGTTYLWFTALHGLVIDARFDVALGFEEDGDLGRGEILAAIGDAIPASADAVVAARVRANEPHDSSVKVAILWDPETPEGESKIWLAYLFARAAFAANETAGGPAVGERESSFEEEVRGRQIALTTFRAMKRDSAPPESAYFNDIDRVEAAGFLREYVWSYLRHASWKTAPANLDSAGFEVWRAEHLATHQPVTHGRIAFRLASAQ